ncbi:MAG: dTMP kinase [Clostridia bacterium]|nr:dTMP kinase [Clostridia bacterium]
MKPVVITLEGGEGSGKSTILDMIRDFLENHDVDFLVTREPGGVPIAEKIRNVILDVNHTEMDARTEALLYAAARRQHLVEKVLPAMDAGKVVVFDRFVDSSLVYQGYCRGIGIDEVYQLNLFATEGFTPDVTLYLDVTPEIGLARVNNGEREVNRLDLENMAFHKKVREGYLMLAERNPNRYKTIDADLSLEEVYQQVLNVLKSTLNL